MKIKKIFISCFLALMLALTPLTMAACGKGNTANVYKSFNDEFLLFKEDYLTFGEQELFNVKSKYFSNYLYAKNDNGNIQYTIQNSISAYGLNFIEKYYPRLQDYKGKASLKKVSSSIEALSEEFDEMKGELTRLLDLVPTLANTAVYNGQFALYRSEFDDFVNEVYGAANALADFMINAGFVSSVGTDTLKQEELGIYIDIQSLRIISDYQKFFFTSCKGFNLSANEFENVRSQYSLFTQVFTLARQELTAEQAKELVSIFEVVEKSRSDYEKAIKGFSMYDYVNSFGYDMAAYLKEEDDALAFYNKICNYLWKDHGVCKLIYNYWLDNLLARE